MSKIFAKVNGLHEMFDTSVNVLDQSIYDTSKIKDGVLASHNINENTIFYIKTDSVDHQLDYRGTYIYSHNELFSNYDNKGGQYIQTNIDVNHNDIELGYAFGKITVSDTNKLWNISYHIQAYSSNNANYNSEYDVYLYGYNNTILGYCAFNAVETFKPYLNHIIVKGTNDIKIGLSFIADNNDRKISIIINDYRNCSFEQITEQNISVNDSNIIRFDATTKGLATSELRVNNATVSGIANVSTANITNLQATTSTLTDVTITNASVSTMTVSTINGVAVGDSPKFTDTDTTYTVTVSGTGNALSTIGLSGTTITATLSSFATSGHNHDSAYSPISHTHGNISNEGTITTSNSISNGDAIVISRSTSGTISKSTITFDGTSSNQFLSQNGTWGSPVDEKVKQSSSTTNQFMPILGAYATTPTSGNSGQAYYNQNIAINTATNTIKVNACQMTYDAAEDCMKFTFNN